LKVNAARTCKQQRFRSLDMERPLRTEIERN
jgi:hypothetical protein